jgi:hypothetical protein
MVKHNLKSQRRQQKENGGSMIYFIQDNGYDMDMHAKIQCMNMHEFL